MPGEAEVRIREALEERLSLDSLRSLTRSNGLIDFCSNDYLGFSRSAELKDRIQREEDRNSGWSTGSTGSRLISGNTEYCERLESHIATFHKADAGLIFNSGYDANLGLFSSLPRRTDTILYDRLVHASIRDGIRLSHARAFPFEHNDLDDLRRRLKACSGDIYVGVESVYSMDGDSSPLEQMAQLCSEFGANLIVDEAHGTGVFGEKGEGRAVELKMEKKVFARVHTFGKALGTHGAIVLGTSTLRTFLLNFARSFIYTTALPFHSLASIRCAYELLAIDHQPMKRLQSRISEFKRQVGNDISSHIIQSGSAIQSVIVPGNSAVKEIARSLQSSGFDVRPIMHPTVPAGSERLRICIHAFNTEEEIAGLTDQIRRMLK